MSKHSKPPTEIELKLDLDPNHIAKVLAHPILQSGSSPGPHRQNLQATYFDTPDHALKQAGVSLRIRSNGKTRIQTVKATHTRPGIAMTRNEWEHEVDGDKPNFDKAQQTALEPFAHATDLIQPVFSLSVDRTIHELSHGSSRIEVVVDHGQVQGQNQASPFAELELELKEGDPADLFGVALALTEAAPLRLSFRTKAERGFEALAGEGATKVKAEPTVLKPRMTASTAFQVIGAACLRHLMANDVIVRHQPSADAVHQMRVALRRLRAAMTLFKGVIADDRHDRIKSELKWMASVLGEARDLDVYIAKVLEPAAAQYGNDAAFQTLLAETKENRNKAYRRVRKTVTSRRFTNGVLEVAAWIQAGPWILDRTKAARKFQDQPVADLAEQELERRWKRILKRGKHLAGLDPEERHQVRIEIKKLRYATEFFDGLFKGTGVKKLKRSALGILEELQETLGELNDIAVGAHMHDSDVAEAIHQDQTARVEGLLSAAEAQYRDFADIQPFWKPTD